MASHGLLEFHLWSKGRWPTVEVAGEFYHQDGIRQLFPTGVRAAPSEFEGLAHLILEPTNRHDRNAVRVEVQGHVIGYLPKEVSPLYVPMLSALVGQGMLPTTSCKIWGYQRDEWEGTDRRGHDLYKTVFQAHATVVLDAPHLCVPANLPPTGAHRLLPNGSALQLRGEEKHLDVLGPFVAPHGEAWVYGTLHSISVGSGRSKKEIVEIRTDGSVIGELTPAMSTHFAPIITHLEQGGHFAAARVLLKGNAIKVEAVLYAAKSHELDAQWIGSDRARHAATEAHRPEAFGLGTVSIVQSQLPGNEAAPPDFTGPAHVTVPPKPTKIIFRAPPGWPSPPDDFEPPPGWTPLPSWPPPPAGWRFWVLAD